MMALKEIVTFPEMRSNHINADGFCTYLAHTDLLVSVYAAESRAKVTVPEVCIRLRPLLSSINRRYQLMAWNVVVKQPWRRQMQKSSRTSWIRLVQDPRARSH